MAMDAGTKSILNNSPSIQGTKINISFMLDQATTGISSEKF